MTNGMQLHGMAKKVNNLFFKYNMMEQWNRSMHIAATKNGVEFLKDHAAGISKHSEHFLSELGLKASDVKVTKDGLLDRGVDGKPTSEAERLRIERVDKALNQFVTESMAHPDMGSNPVWGNDPRFALLMQMKRFTFAHSRYVLSRGIKEFERGNMFVLAPAMLAVPWMIAADSLRDSVNPLSDASYKKNWTYTDYLMNGVERSGTTGRWTTPIDVERSITHGGNGLDGVLGPTAELFTRAARFVHNGHPWDSLFGAVPGAPPIMPD
jgi:hypothetical protein